jgi:hypothetical protein
MKKYKGVNTNAATFVLRIAQLLSNKRANPREDFPQQVSLNIGICEERGEALQVSMGADDLILHWIMIHFCIN